MNSMQKGLLGAFAGVFGSPRDSSHTADSMPVSEPACTVALRSWTLRSSQTHLSDTVERKDHQNSKDKNLSQSSDKYLRRIRS